MATSRVMAYITDYIPFRFKKITLASPFKNKQTVPRLSVQQQLPHRTPYEQSVYKEKTPLEHSRSVSLMLLQKLLNNLIDKLSICTPFDFRHESAHYFTHLGF